MAKRVRDEFWFARRFERSWPAMGAAGATSLSLVRPPLRRAQTTLLAEAKPSKEPTKPTLQIVNVLKQDDQDIAGTTLTRMAGQQISIQAKASDGSSLSNIRWTLSHDKYAIKSYTENDITSPINSTASFSMLSSSDLQQTNISFYWIRRDVNGGTFEAEVTATLSGSSEPKMVKVRFDIVEPTYTGSSQTTGVDVGPFSLLPNFDVSSPNALYCGKMSGTVGTPGIYWNFNVNAGASVSGGLRLTQMIKSLGTIVSGGTSINCPNTAGAYQLDNWASYPSSSPAISIVSNSSAAVPSTADSVADAPYTSLDDSWTSYSRSDRFRMYLMFYPDQADDGGACIWISLAVIEWGWAGSAQHAPAGWAGGGSQTHNNPKPKNSWTLPAWSKVFNNQTACQ
jgi:hypothetical protein